MMKLPPFFQLFAASFALLPLGGCVTASSIASDVRNQEQVKRMDLEKEHHDTGQLLREKYKLEGNLANAKRQRNEVRSVLAETTNSAERSALLKKEAELNRDIVKLQKQLGQFSRN